MDSEQVQFIPADAVFDMLVSITRHLSEYPQIGEELPLVAEALEVAEAGGDPDAQAIAQFQSLAYALGALLAALLETREHLDFAVQLIEKAEKRMPRFMNNMRKAL